MSQNGFAKAATIMSLEEVLVIVDGIEGLNRRDPDGYFVSIFGEPSERAPELPLRRPSHQHALHHGGRQIDRDADVSWRQSRQGARGRRKGLRTLPREEDLARDLIHTLSEDQQKTAIVLATAPNDILTEHSRQAALKGQPNGIRLNSLNGPQGDNSKHCWMSIAITWRRCGRQPQGADPASGE